MTETQLPQPIGWSDVRPGDVIRAERNACSVRRTYEGRVSQISDAEIQLGKVGIGQFVFDARTYCLTLISRPAPERRPGHCKNCGRGIEYAVLADCWIHSLDLASSCYLKATPEPAQPDPILCKVESVPLFGGEGT